MRVMTIRKIVQKSVSKTGVQISVLECFMTCSIRADAYRSLYRRI